MVVSQGPTTKRTPASWARGARQALSGPQTLLPGTGRGFAVPVVCCVLTLSSPFYRDLQINSLECTGRKWHRVPCVL